MSLFAPKPNPLQPLVDELRAQIVYLREQGTTKDLRITELERHVIAISQPSSFSRLYQKSEEQGTDQILPPPVLSPRRVPPYEVKDDHFWDNVERTFAKNVAEYNKSPEDN